jgi:hypothetical protein
MALSFGACAPLQMQRYSRTAFSTRPTHLVNAEYRTSSGGKLIRIDRQSPKRAARNFGSMVCTGLYKTEQNSGCDSDIISSMPDTGERGEISGRVNPKEAEIVPAIEETVDENQTVIGAAGRKEPAA